MFELIILLLAVANCEVLDSNRLWSVSPDQIDITDYSQLFKVTINATARKFKSSDYFIVYFGQPDDLWYSSRIYPAKVSKSQFDREMGAEKFSLKIEGTDNNYYIRFSMNFHSTVGNTLSIKYGPDQDVVFIDTLQVSDGPSMPKISIIEGDVQALTEETRLKIQCTAKHLGMPKQTLDLEIPGIDEELVDHSEPNIIVKSYYINPEDDGKPIRCHLGAKTAIYQHKINIFYGPQTPFVTNPLGETDVVFPGEYLECMADSKPPATFKWIPRHDTSIIKSPIVAQGSKLLIMDNVAPGLRKQSLYEYTCEASNQLPGMKERLVNSKTVSFVVSGGSRQSRYPKGGIGGWDSNFVNCILVFTLVVIVGGILVFVAKWQILLGYSEIGTKYYSTVKNVWEATDLVQTTVKHQLEERGILPIITNYYNEVSDFVKRYYFKVESFVKEKIGSLTGGAIAS